MEAAPLMDIPEPHTCPRRHFSSSSCLSSSLGVRFLSPYIYHHIPLGNVFRLSLCTAKQCSLQRAPIKSMEKGFPGKLNNSLKGMCNIVWTIEADLEAGQFLYITGDLSALGSWEPEIAILMSHTEHTNLWKAELEIAGGVNFKYNYFIKREVWPSCDIIWRPGPEFSLSVPLPVKGGKLVVRDSWMRTTVSSIHPWGSLVEETYFPIQSLFSAPARDEEEIMKFLRT